MPFTTDYIYKCGDVGITHETTAIAKAIQFFERSKGARKAFGNHALMITTPGDFYHAVLSEADVTVRSTPVLQYKNIDVRLYRPLFVSDSDKIKIAENMINSIGHKYGVAKLGLQLIDGTLGKLITFDGHAPYLARRLSSDNDMPICSMLVGKWYYKTIGYDSWGKYTAITPNDIDTYCMSHPDEWKCIINDGGNNNGNR